MSATGGAPLSKSIRDDLDLLIEYKSSTINYYGYSSPGTLQTEARWEILRETLDSLGRTIKLEHAGNSGERDQVWSDRASLQYGP